jgi:hypothetical protein
MSADNEENPEYPGYSGDCCKDSDCPACTGSGNFTAVNHDRCRNGCNLKALARQ